MRANIQCRVFCLPVFYIKLKCTNTVFPAVLYGCETWSVTLGVEHRLRVLYNGVLKEIFGLKREEVTADWRRLPSDELRDLYCSPYVIRVI
jgi:hypothetical protein